MTKRTPNGGDFIDFTNEMSYFIFI